jgi:hypothetical protein
MCLTDGSIYELAVDAAKAAGVTPVSMSQHLSGQTMSCGGKQWAYVSDVKAVDAATAGIGGGGQ